MSEPEKSLQERLAALESAVRFIADTMSRQAGELQALQAGLHGLLRVAGPDQRIRDAIEYQLEKCIAMNLGVQGNSRCEAVAHVAHGRAAKLVGGSPSAALRPRPS